jgi:serine/threonine protein kinase
MSPEQMKYGTTNEYSDVYSFGMTIYEVRHYYLLDYIPLYAPLRFSLVTFHLMISPSGHRCVVRWLIAKTDLLNPDDILLLTAGLTMCCGDSLWIAGPMTRPEDRQQQ